MPMWGWRPLELKWRLRAWFKRRLSECQCRQRTEFVGERPGGTPGSTCCGGDVKPPGWGERYTCPGRPHVHSQWVLHQAGGEPRLDVSTARLR